MDDNERQEQAICDIRKDLNNKVSWIVFIAIIMIIIGLFSYVIYGQKEASASNEIDHSKFQNSMIEIAKIQTDINWIRSAMETNGIKPTKSTTLNK